MASLELRPDLNLMLVQAAVFATNLYVVKHFLVAPYLRLKEAREKETVGTGLLAKRLQEEGDLLEQRIDDRIKEVLSQASEVRARVRQEAEKEFERVVKKAREESEADVASALAQVRQSLDKERASISKQAQALIPAVCRSVLSS